MTNTQPNAAINGQEQRGDDGHGNQQVMLGVVRGFPGAEVGKGLPDSGDVWNAAPTQPVASAEPQSQRVPAGSAPRL